MLTWSKLNLPLALHAFTFFLFLWQTIFQLWVASCQFFLRLSLCWWCGPLNPSCDSITANILPAFYDMDTWCGVVQTETWSVQLILGLHLDFQSHFHNPAEAAGEKRPTPRALPWWYLVPHFVLQMLLLITGTIIKDALRSAEIWLQC